MIAHVITRLFRRAPSSGAILDEMLGELAGLQRSRRHLYDLQNTLRPFARAFPRLEKAQQAALLNYLTARTNGSGPRRRDNILAAIVQLSRFARSRNYLPEDRRAPAEKIRRIKPDHDVLIWSVAEAKLLLEFVNEEWRPWLVLGLFSGLRTSEILRLDWSAFKWEHGVIAVMRKVARKTRTSRLVPIQPNLLSWLESYRDRLGLIYAGGDTKSNENARSREMVRIRRETGLPRKDNACRHSFGSYRLAITQSYEQTALEMGNSPRMIRENYNDPQPASAGAAWFGLLPPDHHNVIELPLPLTFSA